MLRLGCSDNICWPHQVNKTSGISSVHSGSWLLWKNKCFQCELFFPPDCSVLQSFFVWKKQSVFSNTTYILKHWAWKFLNMISFVSNLDQFSLKLIWDFLKFCFDPDNISGVQKWEWQDDQMLHLNSRADSPHWSDTVIGWARLKWKFTSDWLSWWVQTVQAASAGKAWRCKADKSICVQPHRLGDSSSWSSMKLTLCQITHSNICFKIQ